MSSLHDTYLAINYPESDGKPVGESDVHRREILMIIDMLDRFFRAIQTIYVSGNLMFYYEKGQPASVVSPDVFVVKGIPKGLRRSYKLWEEQQVPCTVFEISSRSTRLEDLGNKKVLYAMLGVQEYFLYDPLAEYLRPALQGFMLANDSYIAMLPDASGALISQELGLRLWPEKDMLRMVDISTGQRLLRPFEVEQARVAAEERAESAEERAESAEAEVRRLRAELERLRGLQQ